MNQTGPSAIALSQAALDYQRIGKAIAFISAHAAEQPDLARAARAAHMSEYHFQRVFTRWAGISPKRFLQFLTVEHAKQRLRESRGVLDATLDAGLSSPGRLHDLFVSAEAVTPGEFKSRGAGIEISYGCHPTRFGRCLLAVTSRGVCWLSFLIDRDEGSAVAELKAHWRGADVSGRPEHTRPIVERIFSGIERQTARPLGLLLMGTNFQIKVWRALLQIPAGSLTTYQSIGETIGARQAARAIGGAVGKNAIAYLIPCHRVIRESGLLGGYRWGEERKLAILGWEAARRAA
jgi:AraC family transcriptional regulator of adaptative response/methylated-DNA-[protein]-cysteine methyltransferase